MFLNRLFRRKKDPVTRAAEIKAKYEAKRKKPELFTQAQEELRKELGLTPGSQAAAEKRAERIKRKSAPFDLAVDEAERLKKIHSARRGRK
jgi:hypothetical protein